MWAKLKAWLKQIWTEHVAADDPNYNPDAPPEVIEYVLQMADGSYYAGAGDGSTGLRMVTTSRIDQAEHFPSRFAALHAAAGVEFDRASIVEHAHRKQGRG